MIDVADEASARTGVTASPATSTLTAPVAGRASARPATGRSAGRRGSGTFRKGLEITLFVAPALALLGLFVVVPIARAVQISFFKWKGYGEFERFVGLDNYRRVLANPEFIEAFQHNMVIVVASIAIQLPLGLAIALLLNRKMRGQGILRTIIFVPYVLSEVIAGVIWYQMFVPNDGIIATVLQSIGLAGPKQGFTGSLEWALPAVIAVLTWKYLGMAIILFLAGLQGVPEELYEAAQLDGATWWQIQRRVTIPMLGPTLRTWAFLSMIGSLQLFDMVWVLTGGGPANATSTMATFLVQQGTQRSNYGIASAASVILFIVALVMALLYQRFIMNRDNTATVVRRKKVSR